MAKLKIALLSIIVATASTTAFAQETPVVQGSTEFNQVEQNIRNINNGFFKDYPIKVMREAPNLKGFYEASIGGNNVVVSLDAKTAVLGDVFDFSEMKNLSAEYRDGFVLERAKDQITKLQNEGYPFLKYSTTKTEKLGTMFVFSDVTCGYCQKLHAEIQTYLDAGIDVEYIIYPRVRIAQGAPAYEKSKQIMCADKPEAAFTEIKLGTDGGKYVKESYSEQCVAQLNKGINAGAEIAFDGTPYVYLSNGTSVAGYAPADVMVSKFKSTK